MKIRGLLYMETGIRNIGSDEIRKRRIIGIGMLGFAALGSIFAFAFHWTPEHRFLLIIPYFIGFLGIYQSRAGV